MMNGWSIEFADPAPALAVDFRDERDDEPFVVVFDAAGPLVITLEPDPEMAIEVTRENDLVIAFD